MDINLLDIGTLEYSKCLELQLQLRDMVANEQIGDSLVLVEHPPVLTLGVRGGEDNILVNKEHLQNLGIDIYQTKRGGDVTYHGPGQIVGYPIINLKKAGLGARSYVERIQNMFINLLSQEYSINAHSEANKYTGVWVDNEKITAIGINISRMVSMHGFAYNVNTHLDHFSLINPCGLSDRQPTSLSKVLGHKIDMQLAKDQLLEYFAKSFDATIKTIKLCEIINE